MSFHTHFHLCPRAHRRVGDDAPVTPSLSSLAFVSSPSPFDWFFYGGFSVKWERNWGGGTFSPLNFLFTIFMLPFYSTRERKREGIDSHSGLGAHYIATNCLDVLEGNLVWFFGIFEFWREIFDFSKFEIRNSFEIAFLISLFWKFRFYHSMRKTRKKSDSITCPFWFRSLDFKIPKSTLSVKWERNWGGRDI